MLLTLPLPSMFPYLQAQSPRRSTRVSSVLLVLKVTLADLSTTSIRSRVRKILWRVNTCPAAKHVQRSLSRMALTPRSFRWRQARSTLRVTLRVERVNVALPAEQETMMIELKRREKRKRELKIGYTGIEEE